MGEIGRPRHEVLYELRFWEINRIIRGYRKRDRLTHQLIAEAVFAAMHTMRDSKGKTVKDFFPMLFEDPDDDDREPAEPLSEEDYAYEQALMDNFNFGQTAQSKEASPAPPQQEEAPDES